MTPSVIKHTSCGVQICTLLLQIFLTKVFWYVCLVIKQTIRQKTRCINIKTQYTIELLRRTVVYKYTRILVLSIKSVKLDVLNFRDAQMTRLEFAWWQRDINLKYLPFWLGASRTTVTRQERGCSTLYILQCAASRKKTEPVIKSWVSDGDVCRLSRPTHYAARHTVLNIGASSRINIINTFRRNISHFFELYIQLCYLNNCWIVETGWCKTLN